jgi:hypothetical protein
MIGLGLGSCQAAAKDDRARRDRIAALSTPILGPMIDMQDFYGFFVYCVDYDVRQRR